MRRAPMKKLVFAAIILGGAYIAYTTFFTGGSGPGMAGGAPPVSVAEVEMRDVQQWQEFSGRLVAVDSAEIRPQVSGLIEKVHFKEGEQVKKGQLLFTIEQGPYRAALEAAEARATLTQSELERAKLLLKEKAIPQREYDQRKSAAQVAQAELAQARLNYNYSLVKSPVSGRVSRAEITAGNLVTAGPGAPLLTTVVSDRPIYADFDMDEQSFLRYLQQVGSEPEKLRAVPVRLSVSDNGGEEYTGRVSSFDNQLNAGTGTIRVRAVFDNEDGTLIPGLFARVKLGYAGDTNVMLITDRAVGTDQNKKFVLVVGEDKKAEYRPVVLGGVVGNLRIVREGLKPGEQIIVDGLQRAQPGTPVTPELVPMDSAPATEAPPAEAEEP